MEIQLLDGEPNTGQLKPCGGMKSESKGNTTVSKAVKYDTVTIKKGRYIHNQTSHPLRSGNDFFYKRIHGLEYKGKAIYWFDTFAKHSSQHGNHVGFTWSEHQRFLWMQKQHWLQKEANIRYVVNVVFLIVGVIIGIKSL